MANLGKPPRISYKPVVRPPVPVLDNGIPNLKQELWREVISWVKPAIYSFLFAIIVNNFVIVNATVPSPSMEDTVRTGDRLVAFRLSYLFSEPERYDIVVFSRPETRRLYVKRILGLPGESLLFLDGHVYINGSNIPQRYDFIKGPLLGEYGVFDAAAGVFEPFVIPDGHFFVLGDYRINSGDSRYWHETFIPRGQIVGRVVFRYFPGFANLSNQ